MVLSPLPCHIPGTISDENEATDRASEILAALCIRVSSSPDRLLHSGEIAAPEPPTWLLKANVTVFRHADRTPKQKLKFNFPIGESWTKPFVALLRGEKEEIILREKDQLKLVSVAVQEAKSLGASGPDLTTLIQLQSALSRKIELPGTKAQLKPVYSKRREGQVRKLTKLTLVFKWGGEASLSTVVFLKGMPTHIQTSLRMLQGISLGI
jgi:inositol-hexakisphosphate/diphosphoinositol-pentakisphosphate 1-kinase